MVTRYQHATTGRSLAHKSKRIPSRHGSVLGCRLDGSLCLCAVGLRAGTEAVAPASELPGPTPTQTRWMDLGSGLFIHFGINTCYDVEWSDGSLDPSKYDPDQLDTLLSGKNLGGKAGSVSPPWLLDNSRPPPT